MANGTDDWQGTRVTLRVILFALLPTVPIIVVLLINAAIFDRDFATRFVSVNTAPLKEDYGKLDVALDQATSALDDVSTSIDACQPTCDTTKISALATKINEVDAAMAEAARAALDANRPALITDNGGASALARRLTVAEEARADAQAAIDACSTRCESPAGEDGTAATQVVSAAGRTLASAMEPLNAGVARLNTTLTALRTQIDARVQSEATQPGTFMGAVNATTIALLVAGAALIWILSYLWPREAKDEQRSTFITVRALAILTTVIVFVLIVGPAGGPSPIGYRGAVTEAILEGTLRPGLGDTDYRWFLTIGNVATGLIGAALFAAFATWSIVTWTYVYPNPKAAAAKSVDEILYATATERMAIIRMLLLLAAAISLTALLLAESHFAAFLSYFPEKFGEVSNPVHTMIRDIGTAVGRSYGIALGLALAIAYLSSSSYLQKAYSAERKANGETDEGGVFGSDAFGMAIRFLAIIAPALVAPIIAVLTG